jgi:histidyl-tRNA synthetase
MKITAIRGFRDVLPEEAALWEVMETKAREVFGAYSFAEIIVPIMEKTELFARSIGETTDIVEKEMYTFTDRDGTSVTLRPEGTASVIRAYIENGLHHKEPVSKLFYFGPMLRRERPQKGRYRQFYQIGAEILGRDDPLIDAELLLMLGDFFAALHLEVAMQLNSLGCSVCRPSYRESLRVFGEGRRAELCENCNRRLERNPLRLLDCKEEKCQHTTADAPVILDYTCEACREHFSRVQNYLQQENVEFALNSRMVRGLDYYCRTSFEVIAQGLGSQNAVCGGGRYDGLVEELGGPAVPGLGFAIGVERLAMVLQAQKAYVPPRPYLLVAPLGEQAEAVALSVAGRLRRSGCRVELESGKRGLKSQMRRADKLGVRYVLILGENELAVGKGSVRDMQEKRDYASAVDLGLSPQNMLQLIRNLSG